MNFRAHRLTWAVSIAALAIGTGLYFFPGSLPWKAATPGQGRTIDFKAPKPSSDVILFAVREAIAAGSYLEERNLVKIFFPQPSVPDGAILDIRGIVGRRAAHDLVEHMPILAKDIEN